MALLYAKKFLFLKKRSIRLARIPKLKSQRKTVWRTFRLSCGTESDDNLVYDHFTEGTTKDLFIEAATGTGKTLGYLLPMSYLATPEKPVIISTVSIVLQNQLVEKIYH